MQRQIRQDPLDFRQKCASKDSPSQNHGKSPLSLYHAHESPAFLERVAMEHVLVLFLTPHVAHFMQPMDASIMKPFKSHLAARVNYYFRARYPHAKISFKTLLGLVMTPATFDGGEEGLSTLELTLTPSNIKSGFAASGIWPIDRSKALAHVAAAPAPVSAPAAAAVELEPEAARASSSTERDRVQEREQERLGHLLCAYMKANPCARGDRNYNARSVGARGRARA